MGKYFGTDGFRGEANVGQWLVANCTEKPYFGMKFSSMFAENRAKNLPVTISKIYLNSAEDGTLQAILDANYMTAVKTGASAAIATDLMARKDAASLAVIGTGLQAYSQVLAIQEVRELEKLYIFDIDAQRVKDFAKMIEEVKNRPYEIIEAGSAKECVEDADIICTCTASKVPVFEGKDLKAGDVLVGMASSGVHSNGFSLVRKVFDMTKESLDTYYEELGTTLGEALIAPTRIYVKALKSIKNAGVKVKACSHITGGGFYENIPRMLKDGVRAVVEKDSYPIPPIFTKLAKEGNVDEHAMYNTYNMGIGMIVAVDPADVDKTMEAIKATGDTPYVIGHIEDGEKGVTLC